MNGYLALAGLQTVKPATAEEYVMQKVLEFASPESSWSEDFCELCNLVLNSDESDQCLPQGNLPALQF